MRVLAGATAGRIFFRKHRRPRGTGIVLRPNGLNSARRSTMSCESASISAPQMPLNFAMIVLTR